MCPKLNRDSKSAFSTWQKPVAFLVIGALFISSGMVPDFPSNCLAPWSLWKQANPNEMSDSESLSDLENFLSTSKSGAAQELLAIINGELPKYAETDSKPIKLGTDRSEIIKNRQESTPYTDERIGFKGIDLEHFVHAQNVLSGKLLSESQLRALLAAIGEIDKGAAIDMENASLLERYYHLLYDKLADDNYSEKIINFINDGTYTNPRLDVEIEAQNLNPRAQSIYEAVSNGLDALFDETDLTIGQFGKGIKQLLDWLEPTGEDRIDVYTKQQGKDAYRLTILKDTNGQNYIQIKKISLDMFQAAAGTKTLKQGTVLKLNLKNAIPRFEKEASRDGMTSQEEMADGLLRRFPFEHRSNLFIKTAFQKKMMKVNGFDKKEVIMGPAIESQAEEKKGTVYVGFEDHAITVIDNGIGMHSETVSRMFVPKQGEKESEPLTETEVKDELAKVAVVQDRFMPNRISFSRNGEVITAIDIPDTIQGESVIEGGMMVECGRLMEVAESRDQIIVPAVLKEDRPSNFQLAIEEAIEGIIQRVGKRDARLRDPLSPKEALRYINSIIIGLDGLVQSNDKSDAGVKMIRAWTQKRIRPLIEQVKKSGVVVLPHEAAYAKLDMPKDVLFLHENLFDWQGVASLKEIFGDDMVVIPAKKGPPLVVAPFKEALIAPFATYDPLVDFSMEKRPLIATDRFVCLPKRAATDLVRLVKKRDFEALTDEEEKRLASIEHRISVWVSKLVKTSYEVSPIKTQEFKSINTSVVDDVSSRFDSEMIHRFLARPFDTSMGGVLGEIPINTTIKHSLLDGKVIDLTSGEEVPGLENVVSLEPLMNGYYKVVHNDMGVIPRYRIVALEGIKMLNMVPEYSDMFSDKDEFFEMQTVPEKVLQLNSLGVLNAADIIVSPDKRFVVFAKDNKMLNLETDTWYLLDQGFIDEKFKMGSSLGAFGKAYSDYTFSENGEYLYYLENDPANGNTMLLSVDLNVCLPTGPARRIGPSVEAGAQKKIEYAINTYDPSMVFVKSGDDYSNDYSLVDLKNNFYSKYAQVYADPNAVYTLLIDALGEKQIHIRNGTNRVLTNDDFDGNSIEMVSGSVLTEAADKEVFYVVCKNPQGGTERYVLNTNGDIIGHDIKNPEIWFSEEFDLSHVRIDKPFLVDPLMRLEITEGYPHPIFPPLFIDNDLPMYPVAVDNEYGDKLPFKGKIVAYASDVNKVKHQLITQDGDKITIDYWYKDGRKNSISGIGAVDDVPANHVVCSMKNHYILIQDLNRIPFDGSSPSTTDFVGNGITVKKYPKVRFDGTYFVFSNPTTGDMAYLDPADPDNPHIISLLGREENIPSVDIFSKEPLEGVETQAIVVPFDNGEAIFARDGIISRLFDRVERVNKSAFIGYDKDANEIVIMKRSKQGMIQEFLPGVEYNMAIRKITKDYIIADNGLPGNMRRKMAYRVDGDTIETITDESTIPDYVADLHPVEKATVFKSRLNDTAKNFVLEEKGNRYSLTVSIDSTVRTVDITEYVPNGFSPAEVIGEGIVFFNRFTEETRYLTPALLAESYSLRQQILSDRPAEATNTYRIARQMSGVAIHGVSSFEQKSKTYQSIERLNDASFNDNVFFAQAQNDDVFILVLEDGRFKEVKQYGPFSVSGEKIIDSVSKKTYVFKQVPGGADNSIVYCGLAKEEIKTQDESYRLAKGSFFSSDQRLLFDAKGNQVNVFDIIGRYRVVDVDGPFFVLMNDQNNVVNYLDPRKAFELLSVTEKAVPLTDLLTPEEIERRQTIWNEQVLGEDGEIRENFIKQATSAYDPLLKLIPGSFKAVIEKKVRGYLEKLYHKEEFDIRLRFNDMVDGKKTDLEKLPFSLFQKRMDTVMPILSTYIEKNRSLLNQQDYAIQEKWYRELFEGVVELIVNEDIRMDTFDVAHLEALSYGWRMKTQAQFNAVSKISEFISELKDLANVTSIGKIVSLLSLSVDLKNNKQKQVDTVLGQLQRIMSRKSHVRRNFINELLLAIEDVPQEQIMDFVRDQKNAGALGRARDFIVFLVNDVDELREETRVIPEGIDVVLPKDGVFISQIENLEEQRKKKQGDKKDKVMSMDYLFDAIAKDVSGIKKLPGKNTNLEAALRKNAEVQREPGAYCSEISQNSLDAGANHLLVDFYRQKNGDIDEYVEEAIDDGTGALEEVALLIPKSLKEEEMQQKFAGFFGTGKFTIFEGVDRVEIITKNASGKAYMFTFVVDKNERGDILAVRLSGIRKISKASKIKNGVTVRRIKRVDNTIPELDQMLSKRSWKVFSGLSQTDTFKISFVTQDEKGKRKQQPLVVEHKVLSQDDYRFTRDNRITTGRVAIIETKDLPEQIIEGKRLRVVGKQKKAYFFDLVPNFLKKHMEELGINVQVSLPLIRGRHSFKHEKKYASQIQKYVAIEYFKALAYKTLTQINPQFIFKGFSSDFEKSSHYLKAIDPEDNLLDKQIVALTDAINANRYEEANLDSVMEFINDDRIPAEERQEAMMKVIVLLKVATDKTNLKKRESLMGRRIALQKRVNAKAATAQQEMLDWKEEDVSSVKDIPFYEEKLIGSKRSYAIDIQMSKKEDFIVFPANYTDDDRKLVETIASVIQEAKFNIKVVLVGNSNSDGSEFIAPAVFLSDEDGVAIYFNRDLEEDPVDVIIHELGHYGEYLKRNNRKALRKGELYYSDAHFTHQATGLFADMMKLASIVSLINVDPHVSLKSTVTPGSSLNASVTSTPLKNVLRFFVDPIAAEKVIAQFDRKGVDFSLLNTYLADIDSLIQKGNMDESLYLPLFIRALDEIINFVGFNAVERRAFLSFVAKRKGWTIVNAGIQIPRVRDIKKSVLSAA